MVPKKEKDQVVLDTSVLLASIQERAPQVIKIAHILKEHGYLCYVVGGSVRDLLLGRPVNDFDLASDAEPQVVQQLFRRTIATGIEHGTVTIRMSGRSFEITTFRCDGDYLDGRHPEDVSFVRDINEDLARRDFTINAFALDPISGEFLDLFGGLSDLLGNELGNERLDLCGASSEISKGSGASKGDTKGEQGVVIRAIGVPRKRFEEDALRIMRACRFAAQLEGRIEETTLEAMKELAYSLKQVSVERIFVELSKLIEAKNPVYGVETMCAIGLAHIFDEALADDAYSQALRKAISLLDVSEHALVRWALLFMPFGADEHREGASRPDGGELTRIGARSRAGERAKKATAFAIRLKSSKSFRVELEHMLASTEVALPALDDPSEIRHWLARVGRDYAALVWELQSLWAGIEERGDASSEADIAAFKGASEPFAELPVEIRAELDAPLSIAELAIGGGALKEAGIMPGPHMKAIFAAMLDLVLTNPEKNTAADLLACAQVMYEERS